MISKLLIFFSLSCALLSLCESAYIDTLSKCDMDDTSCQKDLLQSVLKSISLTGIKELKIPSIDPMNLRNIKVSILGLLDIILEEGEARGLKDCVINNMITEYKINGRLVVDLTCDIKIKAKIRLGEISPLIQNTLGSSSVEGGGNAKVKLSKLNVKFELFFDIIRKDDGEIYFKCQPDRLQYEYDIGDAKFVADKIKIGQQDASEVINQFLNQNWKFILKTFGKNFFDVAVGMMTEILHSFFDNTPVKYYISTDLSPYVISD